MPVLTLSSSDVPHALRGPILVSNSYLPRFWPTIYCDVFKTVGGNSTLQRILRAIDKLYTFGDSIVPAQDIDQILTCLDVSALKSVMAGFLSHLRVNSTGCSFGADQTWRAVFDFVYDILKILGASALEAKRLHCELHELKALYGQLSPSQPARPRHITAIPAAAINDIHEVLTLRGDRNPFRCDREQERNLLIFSILFEMGLRRGELLALGTDSLKSEFDPRLCRTRFWLNVAEDHIANDPRYLKGSLKTAASWRSIPVTEALAQRIQNYINGYRGLSDQAHLFLSNQGLPLSAPAVSLVFKTISDALSPGAINSLQIRGMDHIRPHDLRHTSVVTRLQMFKSAGVSLEESIERLRPYYGWSPGSKMPLRYGRAFFETQFAEIWDESFEDHLTALQEIMGGDQ